MVKFPLASYVGDVQLKCIVETDVIKQTVKTPSK